MSTQLSQTDFKTLRLVRDYLDTLMSAKPAEAIDFLTNNGEQVLADFNTALGHEAFEIGDNVLVSDSEHGEFMARVAARKTESDGTPLFTVIDQEDDAFDCKPDALLPDPTL